MKYNISKELFEAVIGEPTEFYKVDYCLGLEATIIYDLTFIKINTFFFKCKEWALKQGYMIVTFGNGYFIYNIKELYDPMEELDKWIEDGLSASEQQAVFDACQWILENKEK